MSEEKQEFESWTEVIADFFERKSNAEEEKFLKEEIKAIAKLYDKGELLEQEEIKSFFDTKKNKKTKELSGLEFQRNKLEKIYELKIKPDGVDFAILRDRCQEKTDKIRNKYEPHKWISEASKNAASVSFATHVFKLTHSKIDSPSVYDQIDTQRIDALVTASLGDKEIDGAVLGNQYAPIFQFLELEFKGKKLASEFADNSNRILKPFIKSLDDLANWNNGFKKSLSSEQMSCHFLAKQIYFPIQQEKYFNSTSYHLLCNVRSSSLAQAVFENIVDSQQKSAKKLRSQNKYSTVLVNSYINKARLKVTASNHSNASQLNGRRGGVIHLFSCRPPTWQVQLKPPVDKKSLFHAGFSRQINSIDIDYLRDFLLRFERIDLSVKHPKRKKWIGKWVGKIIDELLFYAAGIQNLPPGWSDTDGIKLKVAHQYFLDPHRADGTFQAARRNTDWQAVLCDDFAYWLNHRLIGWNKKFTPQKEHHRMWAKLLEEPLREYNQTIEADKSSQGGGNI